MEEFMFVTGVFLAWYGLVPALVVLPARKFGAYRRWMYWLILVGLVLAWEGFFGLLHWASGFSTIPVWYSLLVKPILGTLLTGVSFELVTPEIHKYKRDQYYGMTKFRVGLIALFAISATLLIVLSYAIN